MKNIISTLFILFSGFGFLAGQSGFQYLSSTTGAASFTVEYYGDYLFSGSGFTFRVYDVGPSQSPPYPVLFEHRLGSMIDGFTVSGNHLFIAANTAGFSKWDITDPSLPVKMAEQLPNSLDEAAYDISVKGDTIFVANKRNLSVYIDNGNGFDLLTQLFETPWFLSRVRGCAVRDTLLAFTVGTYGFGNSGEDGVHIYHSETLQELSFRQDQFADHEDVLFGQETDLLHVMGGGKFTSSFFPFIDERGHFYSLDISDPVVPQLVFTDTIGGISIIGDSQAISADIKNDTLYLATRTGWDSIPPLEGNIFVYDVSEPDDIEFLQYIDVGLLHFDVALRDKTMQVASEWFGIRTIEVSDLDNPVTIGDTPTGGWNETTDVYDNFMVQSNEGYGVRLFDITNPANPILVNEYRNINEGFNFAVNFSEDGQYVFASYLQSAGTWNDFRVLQVPSMNEVASLDFFTGTNHAGVYDGIYFAHAEPFLGQKYLSFTDVSDPLYPELITTIPSNANTVELNPDGYLFVGRDDSLLVYDLNNNFNVVHAEAAGPGNQYLNMTIDHDTIYIFRNNLGLQKLVWDETLTSLALTNQVSLPEGLPTRMAVDEFALYLGYTEFGLFAFDKNSLAEIDYYRTGLDFIVPWAWHLEDLVTYNGLIFVVEYFGQTSILTFEDMVVSTEETSSEMMDIKAFPNPIREGERIFFELPPEISNHKDLQIEFLDVNGKIILSENVSGRQKFSISLNGFSSGSYFYLLSDSQSVLSTNKILLY